MREGFDSPTPPAARPDSNAKAAPKGPLFSVKFAIERNLNRTQEFYAPDGA